MLYHSCRDSFMNQPNPSAAQRQHLDGEAHHYKLRFDPPTPRAYYVQMVRVSSR